MTRYDPDSSDPVFGPMESQPESATEDPSDDDGPSASVCADCGARFLPPGEESKYHPDDTDRCQGCR